MCLSCHQPVALMLGKVGAGKSTVFNKVCDAKRTAEITCDSCTQVFVKKHIFYDGKSLELYDGPGCNSKVDTYRHSYVLRHALTAEPLNAVIFVVEFNPRIANNMGGNFFDVAKILKPEYFGQIVLLVTKMDLFHPEPKFPTRASVEELIRDQFRKDYNVHSVIFSDDGSDARSLFHAMHRVVAKTRPLQLRYTDEEFLTYFEMKAWKGREQFDLLRFTQRVERIVREYEEGLKYLVTNKRNFGAGDVQDWIYASIQQSSVELQEVFDEFTKRNGDDAVEFDDYVACIELQNLTYRAHESFRNQAKVHLAVDPDDVSDWRNAIRKCQYCGEVWVKVEGCDGATNCGERPSRPTDAPAIPCRGRLMWVRDGGKLRPEMVGLRLHTPGSPVIPTASGSYAEASGCGREIVWANQQIVPAHELEAIPPPSSDLASIMRGIGQQSGFKRKREEKERSIRVFGELDADGRDNGS